MTMNVMLDLETLGVSPGCAVVAIGAVKFDEAGIYDEFYFLPTWAGRIEQDTVKWWLKQSDMARQELLRTPSGTLEQGLAEFTKFVGTAPVWGNGSDFDNAILLDSYRRMKMQGWGHRQNRCYRTIRGLVPEVEFIKPNIPHHALEDARAQASHLIRILHDLDIVL